MHLNQCKTAKKNPPTSSGFFTFMSFEWRPACRRARNVVPICFIVEKFPREVKGFGQGYMEVKDRNHPNCLPLRKGDLIGQQCLFSRNLWGQTNGSGCLQGLPVSPGFYTGLGVRESLFLQCYRRGGDVLHLSSARWLCPSTEQPGAKQTHSRCQWYVAR